MTTELKYQNDALRLQDDFAQITSWEVLMRTTDNPEHAALLLRMGMLIQLRLQDIAEHEAQVPHDTASPPRASGRDQ